MNDISKAALALPKAVEDYRRAGLYWTVSEMGAEAPLKPEENAATLISSTFEKSQPSLSRINKLAEQFAQGQTREVKEALDQMSGTLEEFHRASLMKRLSFDRDWDTGSQISLIRAFPYKDGVKALTLRALVAANTHRFSDCIADLATARRLCALLAQDPTTISLLVDVACEAVSDAYTERCIEKMASDSASLTSMDQMLKDTPIDYDLEKTFKTESFLTLATLRNTTGTSYKKSLENPDFKPPSLRPESVVRDGEPKDDRGRAYLTRWLQLCTALAPVYSSAAGSLVTRSKQYPDIVARFDRDEDSYLVCMNVMTPQVFNLVLTGRARTACFHGLLQALLIRNQTGHFPTSIEELPGSHVDPFTEGSLFLRTMPDGVRIYSVGQDLEDNGGISQQELPGFTLRGFDVVAAYPAVRRAQPPAGSRPTIGGR